MVALRTGTAGDERLRSALHAANLATMRKLAILFLLLAVLDHRGWAASKPHVISFGRVTAVKHFLGPDESRTEPMNVRPLYVDSKLREFTTGEAHDVTDRLFVVRRAFRLNNNLPGDERKLPSWVWQKGGWLLVDRLTGRVSQLALPDFDPFYSQAAWFRDYVAYCGISDNSEQLLAVVAQLGRKKPIVRKTIGQPSGGETPDSDCSTPTWDKQPTRVTFLPKRSEKQTLSIFGRAVDAAPGSEEE